MLQGWTKIFLYCHHEPSENQEISSTVVLILKQFSAINELSYPRQFYSHLSQISFCFQAGKHCSLWKEENKKFVMRKEIRTPLNLGKTLSFLPSTPCLLPIKYNNSVFSWQTCFFKTHTHSSVWGRRDHWGHGEARGLLETMKCTQQSCLHACHLFVRENQKHFQWKQFMIFKVGQKENKSTDQK